jgi:hypothetical protein
MDGTRAGVSTPIVTGIRNAHGFPMVWMNRRGRIRPDFRAGGAPVPLLEWNGCSLGLRDGSSHLPENIPENPHRRVRWVMRKFGTIGAP